MRDVWLVCRKELAEVFWAPGARRPQSLAMLAQVGVFGVLIPYFQAPGWLQESLMLSIMFLLLPLMSAFAQTASSFAGERERKTLESLMATPLGVGALFFGKCLAVVIQSYGTVAASALASAVALNVWLLNHGGNVPFSYSGPAWFALLATSLAVTLFAVSSGVLISLRSQSVRAAQSVTLVVSILAILPLMLGVVKVAIGWRFLLPATGILLAVDAAVAGIAVVQFGRAATRAARR